jgi:hypothetical protein
VFENRVLRRIFGPKRDEVTGEWRKLSSVLEYENKYTYKTVIRPVILYGSETWTVSGKMASIPMTWKEGF